MLQRLFSLTSGSILAVILAGGQTAVGQSGPIAVTSTTQTSTQNFDTLPSSGTATFNQFDEAGTTIPGFFGLRTGSGTTIVANNGGSNAGNLYSYGPTDVTERALGSLGSGGATAGNFAIGAVIRNDSGAAVNVSIGYTGEQWRAAATTANTISFSFLVQDVAPTSTEIRAAIPTGVSPAGTTAPPPLTGFTPISALDFTSPNTTTVGAIDGNTNSTVFAPTFVTSLNPGQFVTVAFFDPDHTGSDHGLAIDNFSATFSPVPEPATVLAVSAVGLGVVGAIRRRRAARVQAL